MPAFAYRYELRRGEEVVATGHLTEEQALEIGERIVIGGLSGSFGRSNQCSESASSDSSYSCCARGLTPNRGRQRSSITERGRSAEGNTAAVS